MMGRTESNGIGRWLRGSTAMIVTAALLLALATPGCRYVEEKMDRSCCAPDKDKQNNNCATTKEGPPATEPATETHRQPPQKSHTPAPREEAGTAPTPAGTDWAGGTLGADLHAPLQRVHQAARMALAKMDLAIESQILQPPTSTLAAFLGDGEELQVGLKRTGEVNTHIRIRAGYVGNEQMSRRLLHHIQENL